MRSKTGMPTPAHNALVCGFLFLVFLSPSLGGEEIAVHLTTLKLDKAMSLEPVVPWGVAQEKVDATITIDRATKYQTILGMGSSLEPTTCFNISRFSAEDRREVIQKLVDPKHGIGMNLMRICIGTPDFTGDPWYSYCDLPEGKTDPELKSFSIEKDRAYILPVIQDVCQANAECLIFASPWSPPGWMKTTGNMIGGRLKREWYPTYAEYFVRFIKAYEAEGVPIHAITVQNEPGVDRNLEKDKKWWYPSCRWSGEEERDFIRDHLGPALKAAGLSTKIWCYDHNYNLEPTPDGDDPGLDYPRAILRDGKAAALVSGVALHGYAGKPDNMKFLLEEFPKTPLHFSEGSVFGLLGGLKLVSLLRGGITSYNGWVTMSDTEGKPNNGPFNADTTCIQRDVATNRPKYNFDYYLMGHFMKFVPRGSTRIGSETKERIANVAFETPSGETALVMVNSAARGRAIKLEVGDRSTVVTLPGASVMTLVWKGGEEKQP